MTTLGSYHVVESFCNNCGGTIYQYVDFDGEHIIYRENWNTPTGWVHKSDHFFKCGEEYIENDKDLSIRHFKIVIGIDMGPERVELFNTVV